MCEEHVTIHGFEWKKSDVEEPVEWAKTKSWTKSIWSSDSDSWDHDHCQICWWKLHASDDIETNTGYHNRENDNWLCSECYEQFIENAT